MRLGFTSFFSPNASLEKGRRVAEACPGEGASTFRLDFSLGGWMDVSMAESEGMSGNWGTFKSSFCGSWWCSLQIGSIGILPSHVQSACLACCFATVLDKEQAPVTHCLYLRSLTASPLLDHSTHLI